MHETSEARPSEGSEETTEWLRKSEAAVRLGISERTLDKRVVAGRYPKRQTRAGGPVEIAVPKGEGELRALGVELVVATLAREVRPLTELIDRQAAEIADLAGQVAVLTYQLEVASHRPRPWWRLW